jgi:UDPglucose 6-dehydrogenase
MMNVCVIGAGYVGLTTAAVLSDLGHNVSCVDKIQEKIEKLNRGEVPVYESGLGEKIAKNRQAGRLQFSEKVSEKISESNIVLIVVGTPLSTEGAPDLTAIDEVTDVLARSIHNYTLILTKSTVPPGTNERIEQVLLKKGLDRTRFDLASNPEFLREGTAIEDTLHPNKIVVGVKNSGVVDTVKTLYRGIDAPYIITTFEGAEMIKYASNAFLATKISFINELARICDAYNVDIGDVAVGLAADPRIGGHFLNAGLGYGGSCLPKDVSALEYAALKKRVVPVLIDAVKRINQSQVDVYVKKLEDELGSLRDRQITVWGLSFKPNTDDTRSSAAIRLIERLSEKGGCVQAYDPAASETATEATRIEDLYDSLEGSDALVIATEWDEFIQADWAEVIKRMNGNVILDGRNCVNAQIVRAHGLRYAGVGRR